MRKLTDELLSYLDESSKEQLAKDWEELKHFNDIGPDATIFIEQSMESKLDSEKRNTSKKFVLSDVSKEELLKRRIPIYPYLL